MISAEKVPRSFDFWNHHEVDFAISTPYFLLLDEVQQDCNFVVVISSSHRIRAKSPLGTVLIINLFGKGLTPRACMGGGGSI